MTHGFIEARVSALLFLAGAKFAVWLDHCVLFRLSVDKSFQGLQAFLQCKKIVLWSDF